MARMDGKGMGSDERSDGLREKMISVNRVTKVGKGGRILGCLEEKMPVRRQT